MVLYALDMLIDLAFKDFLSVTIHVVALIKIYNGSYSAQTDEETKRFFEKVEKKIARTEKDFAEDNKTPEQPLKELQDRSDVDN